MSWTVVEVDGNGVRETRKGGTLAGERPAEPEPKPKPKMVTWRRCSRVRCQHGAWFRSDTIPAGWAALEAHTLPLETIKQLPEGKLP